MRLLKKMDEDGAERERGREGGRDNKFLYILVLQAPTSYLRHKKKLA
jgi:hypothetical protein